MKPIVYLQAGFWEGLSANNSREGIRTMLDVTDALGDSCVFTDVTEEMILHDDFLKIIIKQKSYHRCDDLYIDKIINNLNSSLPSYNRNLCATYMLNKSRSECESIENCYGVIALNPSTIKERSYLFKGDGFILNRRVRYNQRYLTFREKLCHPCNSLIIIDPYLLKKRGIGADGKTYYPDIANNLESLLDAILPLNLSVDFHLTIISCVENSNIGNRSKEINIRDELKCRYEKIRKCIKRIRKDLYNDIKFGLFNTSIGYRYDMESFHSRHIISNTFVIDSEDGLNLFNENGYLTKNNPALSVVFPRLFGNSRQDLAKYFNWVMSIKKYVNEEVNEKNFWGIKENRLFELVSEFNEGSIIGSK